jgi:hypothetical protein
MSSFTDIAKKVLVALFFFNLLIAGFTYVSPTSFASNNPSIQQLEAFNKNINYTGHNLAGAFNYTLIQPIKMANGNLDLSITWIIPNLVILVVDFLAAVGSGILNFIFLMFWGVVIILYLLLGVVPTFFALNLGVFGAILGMVEIIVTILTGIYAVVIIIELIRGR